MMGDDMLHADELTVVHHDDSVSRFADVRYTLGRRGLRLVTASGEVVLFPQHDVLTTHVRTDAAPVARTVLAPAA